jgi:predicted dinucleotide-binding enzyme
MKIATVGRGNIGGGLGELWAKAGHEVTAVGREGGDVSSAEVVLIAVPGAAVAEALVGIRGLEGKTVIDATNLVGCGAAGRVRVECGVHQVGDWWTDGEVVQPQFRCPV